jgi:hypothetical protein
MDGAMLLESELYNVLMAFKADKEGEKYVVRGNITSFMGMGDEFLIDSTAQYRCNGEWKNLLVAVKATSYYNGVQVF